MKRFFVLLILSGFLSVWGGAGCNGSESDSKNEDQPIQIQSLPPESPAGNEEQNPDPAPPDDLSGTNADPPPAP